MSHTLTGNILRTYRVAQGLTTERLANELNINTIQVDMVESNRKRVDPELLVMWSALVGLPPGKVFVAIMNDFAHQYIKRTGLEIDVNFTLAGT